MHFSPERARAVRRAPARPEWSVASDAEGGSGERGGPLRTYLFSRPRRSVNHLPAWRTQKGRGRLGRPPTPQAPQARGAQRRSRDVERLRAFENTPCLRNERRYSLTHLDSSSTMTLTPSGETSSGIPSTVNWTAMFSSAEAIYCWSESGSS